MERSTIIILRGEGISGVARLELKNGQLDALFSLKPPQQGAILAFFICPGRMVEVPLTGPRCCLDEPLLVEGILLARDLSTGLSFLAEGGALHARLNFPRIREQLRMQHLQKQRSGSVRKEAPAPLLPQTPQAREIPQTDTPPPEISGKDDKSEKNALKRRLNEEVPPGSPPVEGEEQPEPPRSRALRSILYKARELYPQNHEEGGTASAPITETPMTVRRGIAEKGLWNDEVTTLLHQEALPKQNAVLPPTMQNRYPVRSVPGGLHRAQPIFNPFPDAFPRSCWRRIGCPGSERYYLEGEVLKGNARFLVHALPGEYSPVPRQEHREFAKFLRAADGRGYWLRIRRK